MKRLMTVAALAGMTTFASAATFEELHALSRISSDQVTAANAQAVVDASIATTNRGRLAYCRDRGFITAAQLCELMRGKPEFAQDMMYNASRSSNDVVRAACVDDCIAQLKANPSDTAVRHAAWMGISAHWVTAAKRLAVAKDLINSGLKVECIQLLYGGLPLKVLAGAPDEKWPGYNAEYASYCKEVSDGIYAAWLAAKPTVTKTGKLASYWVDGGDIVRYFYATKDARFDAPEAIAKTVKYAKDGQRIWSIHYDTPMMNACRAAFLASEADVDESIKVEVAINSDKALKNKDATKALYPSLKDDANKVTLAIYLNDVDKLIDALKTVGDKLDAKTVESVIAPLNSVNAGYRTADMHLALANVNKKYTLKLYDDRDTWEPILSKIRAMIDAL